MKSKFGILFIVSAALLFLFPHHGLTATDAPTVTELLPINSGVGDGFGGSVSLFHDTLVIGAAGADLNGHDSGAVYVFIRNGNSTWQQQASIVAEDGAAGDGFGASVSISGDTIVIGAPGDDDNGANSGAAYVYVRSGSAWQLQAKLVAADGATSDKFGFGVDIDGDIIIAGAPFDDDKGSAYTFLHSAGTWEQQAKILGYGTAVGDRFGCSVAIGYDTIVIGADGDDNSVTDDGSAYIYGPYGSGWRYHAKLVASDPSEGDRFGSSVAIGLNNALIGVNRSQTLDSPRSGSAYAFIRTNYSWVEEQRFEGDSLGTDDGFGLEVAIYDNFFLVGAPREIADSLATGAVYLFSRAETSPWPMHAKFIPQNGINNDLFGTGIDIFGDTIIAGLPGRGGGLAQAYMYPCGLGRYLPASDWQMISRPCYNQSPASTLLGDDIEGIFNKTWVVHKPDSLRNVPYSRYYYYALLDINEPLTQGSGYWIYSVKEATLDVNGSATPTVDSNECPSVNGCIETPLTLSPPNQRFWNNMVGNPFPYAFDWSDVVVVVTPDDGSAPVALTLSEAYELKLMRSSFYRYENKRYNSYSDVTHGMQGIVRPFESIWVHTLDSAKHSFAADSIKLLLPAIGPLKTTAP